MNAFHDPELAAHFSAIGFKPELYAISWFLTMFSHVLPLHHIFHLWDTLILATPLLPMCFGLGILTTMRLKMIDNDFNECIGNFSALEINFIECLSLAISFYNKSPPSIGLRVSHDDSKISPRISCYDAFRIKGSHELLIPSHQLKENNGHIKILNETLTKQLNENSTYPNKIIFVDIRTKKG
ncbi:hypothetical protein MXB_3103 [Myxobolus squamalis]|nr:hypothetical protein MXB_3103 [Myxobolus squamalis]